VRKLGQALKQVVSEPVETERGAAARSVLMNANRRRVFEYVAWHPCCAAAEIAHALDVSGPTAAWHLRKLAEAGYVVEPVLGRARRYHVAGMALEPNELGGLAALADETARSALAAIVQRPGVTTRDLADRTDRAGLRRAVRTLAAAGWISTVVDGRFRRYYPGPTLAAIERSAPRRLRDFRRRLLRRLERDWLAPEARPAPGDVLEIDIRFGGVKATLRVPTESLLRSRL